MLKRLPILLIMFICLFSNAQDINGTWKGRLVMSPNSCFPVYNIELSFQIKDSAITGKGYLYSDSTNYIRTNFTGTFYKDSNLLIIRENGISVNALRVDCVPCLKVYRLTYDKGSGNRVTDEQLRGGWSTPGGKAIDGKTVCEPGSIVMNRSSIINKPTAPLPPALANKRAELVQEIKVDTGLVHIELYDNGQIDGDTISVYVNNKMVISHSMLKTQPITLTVKVDPNKPIQEVIMVGENMGTIPPNTALMMVMAGDKRYQLYLTADDKKNALVRFIYEKPGDSIKK